MSAPASSWKLKSTTEMRLFKPADSFRNQFRLKSATDQQPGRKSRPNQEDAANVDKPRGIFDDNQCTDFDIK